MFVCFCSFFQIRHAYARATEIRLVVGTPGNQRETRNDPSNQTQGPFARDQRRKRREERGRKTAGANRASYV